MSVIDLVNGKPKTIEELQDYCDRNGFEAHRTRFFVGEDYREPKAFGIYKDPETGEFIVYKNKDNGVRAIRYQGYNEEFAVSELYDRLQAEIVNQQDHYYGRTTTSYQSEYGDDSSSKRSGFEYMDHDPFSVNADEHSSGSNGRSSGYEIDQKLAVIYTVIIAALIIFVFAMGGGKGSRGSSSRYDSGYSYDYNDYDSGWSSDSWDSGYTDWGSDW